MRLFSLAALFLHAMSKIVDRSSFCWWRFFRLKYIYIDIDTFWRINVHIVWISNKFASFSFKESVRVSFDLNLIWRCCEGENHSNNYSFFLFQLDYTFHARAIHAIE